MTTASAPTGAHPALVDRPKAEAFSIEDLLRVIQSGRLRLPLFQRPLRWRTADIEALFDSVYRGFPIGHILVAQAPAGAQTLQFGPVTVTAPEQPDAWQIVDGQQRVVSFAGVLLHPSRAPLGDLHAFWFDLEARRFQRGTTSVVPATWIPLNVVGDLRRLLQWLDRWSLRHRRPELVEVAYDLSEQVRNYEVPVFLVDGADEATQRLMFARADRSGAAMQTAEVFGGLYGRGCERPVQDACDRLEREGFGRLEPRVFERIVGLLEARHPKSTAGSAEQAFRRVIAFLQVEASVPHLSTLPYELPLLVLSWFFAVHPEISPRTATLLRRWVWRGALRAVHSASTEPVVRALCDQVDDAAEESASRLAAGVVGAWTMFPVDRTWNARHAQCRLLALAMVAMRPIDFMTHQPVRVDDESWVNLSRLFISVGADQKGTAARVLVAHDGLPVNARRKQALLELLATAGPSTLETYALDSACAAALATGDREEFVRLRNPILRRRAEEVLASFAEFDLPDHPSIATLLARGR